MVYLCCDSVMSILHFMLYFRCWTLHLRVKMLLQPCCILVHGRADNKHLLNLEFESYSYLELLCVIFVLVQLLTFWWYKPPNTSWLLAHVWNGIIFSIMSSTLVQILSSKGKSSESEPACRLTGAFLCRVFMFSLSFYGFPPGALLYSTSQRKTD